MTLALGMGGGITADEGLIAGLAAGGGEEETRHGVEGKKKTWKGRRREGWIDSWAWREKMEEEWGLGRRERRQAVSEGEESSRQKSSITSSHCYKLVCR